MAPVGQLTQASNAVGISRAQAHRKGVVQGPHSTGHGQAGQMTLLEAEDLVEIPKGGVGSTELSNGLGKLFKQLASTRQVTWVTVHSCKEDQGPSALLHGIHQSRRQSRSMCGAKQLDGTAQQAAHKCNPVQGLKRVLIYSIKPCVQPKTVSSNPCTSTPKALTT